jgi:alpha-L-fucosidase 2
LFDAHPPFQIDGNFGYAAGIAEMLLQSHEGKINLLPALPSDWKSGKITGLKARGNIEVSLEWKDGKLLEATLLSPVSKTIQVRYNLKTIEVKMESGKMAFVDIKLFD